MRFSENWLRSFVDPALDSDALGHLMTMAGLEVEEAVPAGAQFSSVVVGHILSTSAHPDADRLLVLKVRLGEEERQIVAGIRAHYEPEALVGKTDHDFY